MVLLFTLFAAVLFGTFDVYAEDSFDLNYPYNFFNKELLQKNTRTNFTLKCSKNCFKSNSTFRWEFQPCGREFDKTQCNELLKNITKQYRPEGELNWRKIDTHGKCSLDIKGATQGMSGLYRCLEEDTIVMVYTVEIINGEISKMLKSKPKLKEIIPYNTTAMRGTQINIQCKVVCDIPPEIRWFKVVDGPQTGAFEYNDSWYVHVNASPSENDLRFQGVDIYVSKLKIPKARESDSGRYRCLAITGSGNDSKDTFVFVDGPRDTEELKTSFPMLFLIPACLALVPITVWLCYIKRKPKNGAGNGRKTVAVNSTRISIGGVASTAIVPPPLSINGSCCRNGGGGRPYKYTNVVLQNGVIDRDTSSARMDSFEFKV